MNEFYLPLTGEEIKNHYDHKLVIASYGNDENLALECNDCYEVLCDSSNPKAKTYQTLLFMREKIKEGYKIITNRIGGYYGKIELIKDLNCIIVYESKRLI